MSNTLSGHEARWVPPEGIVGDQLAKRRQAVRRGGREASAARVNENFWPSHCAND